VFSASYFSFLLAPLPAIVVARALGKPVILNYRSGEAPDHLRRSTVARVALSRVDENVVPSRFLVDVFAGFGINATVVPNIVDLDRFSFRDRNPLRPRLLSTRNLEALYDVACTLRAFRLVLDRRPDAMLTLVGRGSEEPALRRLADGPATGVVRRPVARRNRRLIPCARHLQIRHRQHADVGHRSVRKRSLVVSTDAGGVPANSHMTFALAPVASMLAAHVRLLDEPSLAARLTRAAYATCAACMVCRSRWLVKGLRRALNKWDGPRSGRRRERESPAATRVTAANP
jgi:glycosyltransferase involved in cell wall biosynthesis